LTVRTERIYPSVAIDTKRTLSPPRSMSALGLEMVGSQNHKVIVWERHGLSNERRK
jgi:hypothetical protein